MRYNRINRRDLIKSVAVMCGVVLSTQSLALLAVGFSTPADKSRRKDRLLNPQQLMLVQDMAELVIPTTETPGAIAADVHNFIDQYAFHCLEKSEQQTLTAGLQRISTAAKQLFSQDFLLCESAQKIALLTHMEKAQGSFDSSDRTFVKAFKALVVFAYYTSEIGATKELIYLAIPGGYKGSVPFATVGKTWAL